MSVIAPESVPDAGAFLARLGRFDPAALVRLRPLDARPGLVTLWARLPFDVLVGRTVHGTPDTDATVLAAELLAVLDTGELPTRRDAQWRGALPPTPARAVDEVPADDLRRIATAAGDTLRQMRGAGVGERRLRDALLDHVALTLRADDDSPDVPVPTRVVTALVRMAFLGPEPVRFGTAGQWLIAHATYGTVAYRRPGGLTLDPVAGG